MISQSINEVVDRTLKEKSVLIRKGEYMMPEF